MKKLILLSIITLILAGCSNNTNTVINQNQTEGTELTQNTLKPFEGIPDTFIIKQDSPSREVTRTKVSTLVTYGEAQIMTGCFYNHKYQDLGISIETKDVFRKGFETCPDILFSKDGNMIVNGEDGFLSKENKLPNISIPESFLKTHKADIENGCKVIGGDLKDNNTQEYFVVDKNDGACLYKKTPFTMKLIVNIKKPDTYLLLATPDGCAPGGCSDFETINWIR